MTETGMKTAVTRLTGMVNDPNRYDIPHAELLPAQLEAADELFEARLSQVKLLANRAETGGVDAIRERADIVPLLFAHTAYKSYPEGWLNGGKWDRLTKWLETVTAQPTTGVDLTDVQDIDEWLERLARVGHFVSCSSGTTGKCSIMDSAQEDLDFRQAVTISSIQWALGVKPANEYFVVGTTPVPENATNIASRGAYVRGYGKGEPWLFPGERITVGSVQKMIALRRRIAEGAAQPGELASLEATSAARAEAIEQGYIETAKTMIARRGEKMFLTGFFGSMYRLAEVIRDMGHAGDFHPENLLLTGGGLKGTSLPDGYREFIFETFNVSPGHVFHLYGMQEMNTIFPKCSAGRYHVPPWVMLLLLDETGEQIIGGNGEMEGRAAFLDLSMQGRWGGVISGDKIHASFEPCACGQKGPNIADDVVRYSELPGGDKITCSGTIDAYVRGVT